MKTEELTKALNELVKVCEENEDNAIDAHIFANALMVGMSHVEGSGLRFESPSEAMKYLNGMMKNLIRGSGKSILMQKLRKYDRVGGERTKKVYKRSL